MAAEGGDGDLNVSYCVGGLLFLFLGLAGVGLILYFIRKAKLAEKSKDPGVQWTYVDEDGNQVGPKDSSTMRDLYVKGTVKGDTVVKLPWMKGFLPLIDLYPEGKDTFLADPRLTDAAVDPQWHRASHVPEAQEADKMYHWRAWFYKGLDGGIHGPFEAAKMAHWFFEGLLPDSTPVRMDSPDGDFVPISKVFPQSDKSFASEPKGQGLTRRSYLAATGVAPEEHKAGEEDKRLGITIDCERAPKITKPIEIVSVKDGTWGDSSGISHGACIVAVNGVAVEEMAPQELELVMKQRPLVLLIVPRVAPMLLLEDIADEEAPDIKASLRSSIGSGKSAIRASFGQREAPKVVVDTAGPDESRPTDGEGEATLSDDDSEGSLDIRVPEDNPADIAKLAEAGATGEKPKPKKKAKAKKKGAGKKPKAKQMPLSSQHSL